MDCSGHRGFRLSIGDDGEPGIKRRRETQCGASEFRFVQREKRLLGGCDHLALSGCNQRVVAPDPFFGDAGAAHNRDIGMHFVE